MGVHPIGGRALVLMGELFKKNCRLGGAHPAMPPTMGNPDDDDDDD